MNISEVTVILGNEDGTFGEQIISSISSLYSAGFRVAVDFNNDSLLDIVVLDKNNTSIHVLLGNGDGTFEEIIFFIENCTDFYDMSIGNLNNDQFLDFAIVCLYTKLIIVIFGNDNGTVAKNIFINTLRRTHVLFSSVQIADLNSDNYGDIVVTSVYEYSIIVFLGRGNESFDTPKMTVIGRYLILTSIAVGDFNHDQRQDVLFLYSKSIVSIAATAGLIFGYNNGTFDIPMGLNLSVDISNRPLVSDLNGDGYLDLVTVKNNPYTLNIYFADGKGNFRFYTLFPSELVSSNKNLIAIDFNDDGYQDIFATSDFGPYIFLNTGLCKNTTETVETSTLIDN